jgi:transposase
MLGPALKGVPHLGLISRSIVDPRHSRLVAAYVVQNRLKYICRDTKPVGHHCGAEFGGRGPSHEALGSSAGLRFALTVTRMPKKSTQPSRASRSLALRRGLDILCLFTDVKREWGITALATHLNEHKSLVHRTVKTLEDAGFLRQDAQTQKYSLGFTAYQLGVFASRRLGITAVARARLSRLTEEIDATVYIAVRDGDANRIVDTFETSAPIRFHSPVGTRIPWSRVLPLSCFSRSRRKTRH